MKSNRIGYAELVLYAFSAVCVFVLFLGLSSRGGDSQQPKWHVVMTSSSNCSPCARWKRIERPKWKSSVGLRVVDVYTARRAFSREERWFRENKVSGPFRGVPGWLLLHNGKPYWKDGKPAYYQSGYAPASKLISWSEGIRKDA